jgi:hypothetical protein
MDTATLSASDITGKFRNRNVTAPLGPIARYNLRFSILLTLVPFFCGLLLMLLLTVFAKLNLYYLEASGMLVNDQVRDAYFAQVQIETMSVAGFLLLQMLMTAAVSIVVMRWASAPFTSALRTVETAMNAPDKLRPSMRLLSESPGFDRVIWLFALRVKNGGENQIKESPMRFTANLLFLGKFVIAYTILSIVTGRFMGMTIGIVYDKIVALAIQLVKNTNMTAAGHYFSAQQDVLQDAITITTVVSVVVYLLIGLNVARYMSTMIWVFSRALEEDRFPVQLRTDDVYHGLAASLNRARERIK